jgi:CDP-diacylglycerol--glycerol-3-phosphate 3-phosphatidyltransferase
MKLRHIPNSLSIMRILLCVPLMFLTPFTPLYMVLFFVAGSSDMIDGPLARRIKGGASELGATLDSIADVLLIGVGIFKILPMMEGMWGWLWLAYVSTLTLKVFASTGIGFYKFKEIISLHTISFKVLVIAMFSIPLVYYIVRHLFVINETAAAMIVNILAAAVIISIFIAVIEEILIISMLKRPERNIKSIFGVPAANRKAMAEKQTP